MSHNYADWRMQLATELRQVVGRHVKEYTTAKRLSDIGHHLAMWAIGEHYRGSEGTFAMRIVTTIYTDVPNYTNLVAAMDGCMHVWNKFEFPPDKDSGMEQL